MTKTIDVYAWHSDTFEIAYFDLLSLLTLSGMDRG